MNLLDTKYIGEWRQNSKQMFFAKKVLQNWVTEKQQDTVQKAYKRSNVFWDNLQQEWQNRGGLVNE